MLVRAIHGVASGERWLPTHRPGSARLLFDPRQEGRPLPRDPQRKPAGGSLVAEQGLWKEGACGKTAGDAAVRVTEGSARGLPCPPLSAQGASRVWPVFLELVGQSWGLECGTGRVQPAPRKGRRGAAWQARGAPRGSPAEGLWTATRWKRSNGAPAVAACHRPASRPAKQKGVA